MGKRPLSRKEAFFGLHFDLHPNANDTQLGEHITEEMIYNLINRVQPDFIQYDCKGHPGYTGYPTKVGWSSPGIKQDSLSIWRKVTEQHGIALFIHYSGVWDSVAVENHPEWACVNADGSYDKNITSTFGPYCDELLIPQLKEIIDNYNIDGVWVDGDCWAVEPDFSKNAREAFTKATGIQDIPTKSGEPHWHEYLAFQRDQFKRYVAKYTEALHSYKPGFEVTSNWMYSTLMPDPVTTPIDFISGDFSPNDSVNTARLEARYISSTGMPWDLMAWGFNKGNDCGWTIKSAVQLMQEASVVLSQGGSFQIYYQPTRAGWIDNWMVNIMAEVADFCRKRQEFSHKTQTVPQVALLLSSTSIYDKTDRLFGPWGNLLDPIQGVLHALLELHYSVDVMAEHKLLENLLQYPVVVIPECEKLPEDLKSHLVDYVRQGGQMLLIGVGPTAMFRELSGVTFEGEPTELNAFVSTGDSMAWLGGLWQKVNTVSAKVISERFQTQDMRGKGEPAVTINHYGKGQVGAIFGPLGSVYMRSHYPALRQILKKVMDSLLPNPMVQLDGPPCIDVSIRKKDNKYLIHLGNTAGMQIASQYAVIDFIPKVGPITAYISLDKKPKHVSLEPGGQNFKHHWSDGKLEVIIPELHIHNIIVIE